MGSKIRYPGGSKINSRLNSVILQNTLPTVGRQFLQQMLIGLPERPGQVFQGPLDRVFLETELHVKIIFAQGNDLIFNR